MGALDSKTYTSTWGSLGFFYQGNGGRTLSRPGRAARYQIDDLPYGTQRVIQMGGSSKKQKQIQAIVKAADINAWLNAINTTASLTLKGVAQGIAYLADIGDYEEYPDSEDVYMIPLTFEF
jgi:hypothetical protein